MLGHKLLELLMLIPDVTHKGQAVPEASLEDWCSAYRLADLVWMLQQHQPDWVINRPDGITVAGLCRSMAQLAKRSAAHASGQGLVNLTQGQGWICSLCDWTTNHQVV